MPAVHAVDPVLLDTLAAELTRSSTAALEASHELLAHYSDPGSPPTQRAVDTLIDHAADALRALTDSFADISGELQATAPEATPPQGAALRSAGPAGTAARTRPRPERLR